MSIDRTYALQNLDKPAVLCCRAEANTFLAASNLEDPAIFPDLVDSGLLNLNGCLLIGQVLGADALGYSTLTVTCDSLTPITPDIVDQYLEDAPVVYRPMSKLQVGDSYYEIVDETARAQGGHTELTQAEYNALSQAEKENGEIYFITDGSPLPSSLVNMFYPVGSYYETSDASFDPNVAWGGTWSLEAEGLVHIGAGSTYTIGDTGGEETHTLTVNEMPNHGHSSRAHFSSGNTLPHGFTYQSNGGYTDATNPASSLIELTGGSQAHNNMQPYIVVNRWHRTA